MKPSPFRYVLRSGCPACLAAFFLLTAGLVAGTCSAKAAVILVDFGGTTVVNPDGAGNYWNATLGAGAVSNFALINSNGSPSGILLSMTAFGGSGSGAPVPTTAGYTAFPANAYEDFDYLNNAASQSATLTFSGLDSETLYSFNIYSARTASGTRSTTFTISGLVANSDTFTLNSVGNSLVNTQFADIAPNVSQVITLTVANNDSQFGYLNFIEITTAPAPEPAGLATFGLLSLALAGARRSRISA